jgi:hypothetical protein
MGRAASAATTLDDQGGQPEIDAACAKRSFLKLPVPIDVDRLLAEYGKIPETAWGESYWDVHCSIDVILLRGGARGDADDYVTSEVSNGPLLDDLPYLASLLGPDGPFGGTVYAFVFRMAPGGITHVHEDDHESWRRPVRIHVPITTNDGAFLLSEGRACHLSVGEAWTFNNQVQHAVVNGDTTRVHLIFDVHPNPKLAELMQGAAFEPGDVNLEAWARAGGRKCGGLIPPLTIATGRPLDGDQKQELGLSADGFATRVVKIGRKAKLLRTGLKEGDIITDINGVDHDIVWSNALDHLRMKHAPGDTVTIRVVRDGTEKDLTVKLRPPDYLSASAMMSSMRPRSGR